MRSTRRVVVTGLGVASALGCDVEEFWRRLTRGDSGVGPLEDEAFAALPTRIGAVVKGYDESAHFDRKGLRRLSRSSQLRSRRGEQGGAPGRARGGWSRRRDVAVLIGSSIGGYSASDYFFRDFYLHGRSGASIIPTTMNTAPSSNVSIRFGFGGPLINVDAACASGSHSVGYAFSLIRSGTLDSRSGRRSGFAVHAGNHEGLVCAARAVREKRPTRRSMPSLQC